MNAELEKLKSDFEVYYSSEHASDEEDTNENIRLRENAVQIIANALKSGNTELADQTLNTLSENTGCAEDISIFEDLAKPLVALGLITKTQINVVVNTKAVSRWK